MHKLLVLLLVILPSSAGCGLRSWSAPAQTPLGSTAIIPENPIFVPTADREFLWNQTVDSIDDYFRITREERVHVVGDVLTEGRIETAPTVGGTVFEPWVSDSSPGFEKLHSTFQSIRRQATVRATPAQGGYLIEVVVQKELEDVSQPEHAAAGASTMRYDGSLGRRTNPLTPSSGTLGWIGVGRDVLLEQRILADIRSRLGILPQT